ncbi:MAG TPA: protein kinase [Candidatus Polarisedimenticolaceae bacterium]|nr:protein kinase [Candidatus Polarisedimenticolaceae bacterium]
MPLASGTQLGPYEITSPLGAGGMGEVYRAKDTRLGREVAIKVLPQHLSSNPEIRARFEREAKAVSSLNHPNVCTLHDVGRQGDTDYLVMELIEGETLAQRLAKGALPLADVLRIGGQIADALDRAHRAGVSHRDLKPGNVMLTKSGAKLMDFGLARATGLGRPGEMTSSPTVAAPLTAEGTILGTFQYMAPEQLEGRESDARADLWAFGCVLYEMATGKRAFEGATQASLISAIMRDAPRPAAELMPTTPPALDHLIRMCLVKDPDERIQTAHDVRLQLRWIGEGSSAGAAPVATMKRPRIAWTGWIVGALGVALALFALLALRHGDDARVMRTIVTPPEGALFLFGGDNAGPPVISPDGKRVAFVAVDDRGGASIWLRDLASLKAEPIPGTESATYPFWSPDGHSLGFFADLKLKRVDIDTRQVMAICPAPGGRGGTWSASGVIVFSPDYRTALQQVSAMGGTPQPATTLASSKQTTHRWPHFLPDGKHLLYYAGNHDDVGGQENSVWVASLDGKENRTLVPCATDAQYAGGYLFYVQDSVLIARPFDPRKAEFTGEPRPTADRVQFDPSTWKANVSVTEKGVLVYQPTGGTQGSEIQIRDRSGKLLRKVAEVGNHFAVRLSHDGKRIAYSSQLTPSGDIFVYDIERGAARRLTTGDEDEDVPLFSPDGRWIAYTKNVATTHQPGDYAVMVMASDGGPGRTVLKADKEDLWPVDWSADGRKLLVGSGNWNTTLADRLGVASADGTGSIQWLDTGTKNLSFARISHDGRFIAYGVVSGGQPQVFIAPAPGTGDGSRIQISPHGGVLPQWGPGDRELVYWRSDGTIVSVPLAARSMQPGAETPLFRVLLRPGYSTLDMAADGATFVVNTLASEGAAPIVVVSNWTQELPKP